LNGVLGGARIQFLDAHAQRVLQSPTTVAGIRIAGLADLLAMKLKVVGDRGELRDYFDLQVVEERSPYRVEQGIAFYVARYQPSPPEPSVAHIVQGLGYFGDVADDPGLPTTRAAVERYWRRRQPEIAESLAKDGIPHATPIDQDTVRGLLADQVPWRGSGRVTPAKIKPGRRHSP
jgi:hypothetical protein